MCILPIMIRLVDRSKIRCWCGRAGTVLDRHGKLSMAECATACAGDGASLCGGTDSLQAFEFGALEQPAGHLGCFADNRSRVFDTPYVRSNTNTAEVCMRVCVC